MEKEKVTITAQIPAEIGRRFKAVCEQNYKKPSEVLRELILGYIGKNENNSRR